MTELVVRPVLLTAGRAIVRDLIADLVVRLITWLVMAGPAALATAGTALPLAIGAVVGQVADTGLTISRRLGQLDGMLKQSGAAMERLEDTMRTGLLPEALRGPRTAEAVGLVQDAGLEYGKQDAAARATGSGWDDGGNGPASG